MPSISDGNAWIYQAVGAGFFMICGFVEYHSYTGHFRYFLILAGISSVIAEVLDGHKKPESVHFNFLANHLYFFEAIRVYSNHQGLLDALEIASKFFWANVLMIADLCFILGAMIDTILSWMKVFTTSPDAREAAASRTYLSLLETDDQKRAALASAILWFLCSLLTLMVYMRIAKSTTIIILNDPSVAASTNLSPVV